MFVIKISSDSTDPIHYKYMLEQVKNFRADMSGSDFKVDYESEFSPEP